jgi:hypothetical protein
MARTTKIVNATKFDCLERCDSEIVFIDTPHSAGGEGITGITAPQMLEKLARFARL